MDDDYEALGFHHLDTLLPDHPLVGPLLPGVDLTLWLRVVLTLLAVGMLVLLLT